jgi:SAM-dependent methyltransferase
MWEVPDPAVGLVPDDLTGRRAIELGCGTAYWSAWLARRGAQVVGIDNSERQLATARRLADAHGVDLTLLHGNAEEVPYPDGSFDLAFSEYGAATWCDPERWIPEAFRLLKPGCTLTFLGMHPLASVCTPADGSAPCTDRLERGWFGLGRMDWRNAVEDPGGIEFNLGTGEWVALFRRTGFEIVDYRELRPADGIDGTRFYATADWARAFPTEQVWHLRRP